jgi:hypothetical protein
MRVVIRQLRWGIGGVFCSSTEFNRVPETSRAAGLRGPFAGSKKISRDTHSFFTVVLILSKGLLTVEESVRAPLLTVLSIALLQGACVGSPGSRVPVRGDVARLEGYWSGEYNSTEPGRSGSISFRLDAGADTAIGDVVMLPQAPQPVYGTRYFPVEPSIPAVSLGIRLVQVFGHQVAGQLMPYRDPECDCIVTTIFSGRLEGNVLEGVYFIYRPNVTLTGTWRVQRGP